MRKYLALLTVIAVSALGANAQNGGNDRGAKRILKNVTKTYKTYKTIKTEFSVTNESPDGKSKDRNNGVLYLKGDRFRLDIAGQEIYCDGKTVWTYLKEANEVQVNRYNPAAGEINPNDIFTLYEKGFNYRFLEEVTEKGKVLQLIELVPKDGKKMYFKIKLYVDKTAKMVHRLRILNKDGSSTTYEVIRFTANPNLTDGFFVFDTKTKPGVRVEDLR